MLMQINVSHGETMFRETMVQISAISHYVIDLQVPSGVLPHVISLFLPSGHGCMSSLWSLGSSGHLCDTLDLRSRKLFSSIGSTQHWS